MKSDVTLESDLLRLSVPIVDRHLRTLSRQAAADVRCAKGIGETASLRYQDRTL